MMIATLLVLTQGQFSLGKDGFVPMLSHPVYQENGWAIATLDPKEPHESETEKAIRNQFRGHRHDVQLLKKFQAAYDRNPSLSSATAEGFATLAFLGIPYGDRVTYREPKGSEQIGMRAYWRLVKHWPPTSSTSAFKLRTQLFVLIGGDYTIRPKAIKSFLTAFPENSTFLRMKLRGLVNLEPAYKIYPISQLREFLAQSENLHSKDQSPANLQLVYVCAYTLAIRTRDKNDVGVARKRAENLIASSQSDSFDKLTIPDIEKAMSRLSD